MYCVVWQYQVREDQQNLFEQAYGSKGVWSQLFSTSQQYKGSQLSKCLGERDTYLLLDWWEDAMSYEAFLKNHESTYASLSKQYETVYVKEARLGEFEN